jgi:starch phosphorylase
MADFDAYLAAQTAVEKAYIDKSLWTRMSILNVARCGKFSSDRTIGEYAKDIWDIEPMPISLTEENE